MSASKKSTFDLQQELELQGILIEIASNYINADIEQVDSIIQASLEKMGRFVKADRSYIFDYDFVKETSSNTYEWCGEGIEPEIHNLQDIPLSLIPLWVDEHRQGKPFYVPDVKLLPIDGEEGGLRSILEPQGIQSLITIPLSKGNDLMGFVGFDSVRELHVYSEKEQRLLHLFGQMLINIRMRRRWEDTLRLQEEKYRNIIANMNLGLLEVDPDDTILFANQSFCDMSGYDLNEIKGLKAAELFVCEDSQTVISEKNKSREMDFSDSYIVQALDKQGNKRWWYISGGPNYDDKGNYIGSIGIHLDITDQKALEKDLESAKNAAEEAAKSKELFLANMSHEIRTPLNVIIGMVRELAKQNLGADQRFYVAQSDSAAKHLLTILNHILDMAKIDSGELSLEKADFSLSAVASNAFSILESQAREKNIEFKLIVDETLAPAYLGDEGRLRQILINILGNAIKFTNEGSVNFRVDLILDLPTEQHVRLTIADTGIGMSEAFQKRLFGKFAQEESEANRRYEGTGLGLAITRELVALMGGDISVRSKQGIGSTFTIELVLSKGNIQKLRNTTGKTEKNAFKGRHILLVEDNEMNRFIALQSLHHFGFTVDEAINGKVAVEMASRTNYDLILMDIQMPEMDGVEATKRIRDQLSIKTPIIALTANAFRHDIERYLSNGMVDYITKPYSEEELFGKLRLHLNHSETQADTPPASLPNSKFVPDNTANIITDKLYDIRSLVALSQGDEIFVQKMIEMFIALADQTIVELQMEMQNGNFEQVKRIIHRIKPSLDNMGIYQLAGPISELEIYPPYGDTVKRKELIEGIIDTLKHVNAQIKADR